MNCSVLTPDITSSLRVCQSVSKETTASAYVPNFQFKTEKVGHRNTSLWAYKEVFKLFKPKTTSMTLLHSPRTRENTTFRKRNMLDEELLPASNVFKPTNRNEPQWLTSAPHSPRTALPSAPRHLRPAHSGQRIQPSDWRSPLVLPSDWLSSRAFPSDWLSRRARPLWLGAAAPALPSGAERP